MKNKLRDPGLWVLSSALVAAVAYIAWLALETGFVGIA